MRAQCHGKALLPPGYSQGTCGPWLRWIEGLRRGNWTLEEATQRYITWVYAQDRNFVRTAEKLDIDRRTVKAKLDQDWLREIDSE